MCDEARGLSVQIMDRESTGRRIKAARQLAHLTVPQFAARLDLPGLGAKTLGSIERGERELRPQELEPIASALGVPASFLVGENPAGASDPLADRFDALEQRVTDQLGKHAREVESQLGEQTDTLKAMRQTLQDIRTGIVEEQEARKQAEEARRQAEAAAKELRLLLDALAVAIPTLAAGPQPTASERGKRAK